jgi:hypothetical protein
MFWGWSLASGLLVTHNVTAELFIYWNPVYEFNGFGCDVQSAKH